MAQVNKNKEMIINEIENYKKAGLFKRPKKKLLDLLDLKYDEEVLINLSLIPSRSILKNNVRERYAKCLVLTTERIFIINRGWIIKEVISFDKITNVLVTRKWLISADLPVIIIKTVNNSYEIYFHSIFSYKKKIKGIIACIKNRNFNINIEIDLRYSDDIISFIKDSLFTKIKFK
jgi:hypothetical protein